MINPKKLIMMARKWEKRASIGRKRISFQSTNDYVKMDSSNKSSSVANKGHFVIYTTDDKRFVMPLAYLNNNIFRELFKKSEEVFGISSGGPITLPCDAAFMNYIILLIQRGAAKDLEKALLNSIATKCCSISACHQEYTSQNLVLCGC
ncbi:auxin-responsive protein SAUR68-like [Fagus crenata]